MKPLFKLISFIFFLSGGTLFAQKNHSIAFNDFGRNELYSQTFKLHSKQTLHLKAIAPKVRRSNDFSSIWIISSSSREPVWTLNDAESRRFSSGLREYEERFDLSEGTYEIFFSTHRDGFDADYSDPKDFISEVISRVIRGEDSFRLRDLRKFSLELKGEFEVINSSDKQDVSPLSIISLNKMGESEFQQIGLDVSEKTTVEIYAVGEIFRRHNADYIQIKSLKDYETIWNLSYKNSDHAGGGYKNRFSREKLTLNPGRYLVTYSSDDSHHFDDWNVAPPYDPASWGIQIFARNSAEKTHIKKFDYTEKELKNKLIDLTQLGDDAYESKGFNLSKASKIRILALGEGTGRHNMVDYGWIVNTQTHEKVWEMDYRDTEHAGGASKNRMSDEIIELQSGSYMVYFVTDDSHSYADRFNSSRPMNEKNWGIALYGYGDAFDMSAIGEYKPVEETDIISQIVQVRERKRKSRSFTLEKETKVRIYAIGEGSDYEMSDYGWIEDEKTGRIVWEMNYHDTDHAGGGRKNRQVNEMLHLKAGEYTLHFRTDRGHSFRNWNTKPPHDQDHYGITVYKAN